MLDHLGESEAATLVMDALRSVALNGPRTKDLGGSASTVAVGDAIEQRIGTREHQRGSPILDAANANATGTSRRPYAPGLEGVVAGETSLSLVDGERGRLLYRGYPIGDLVPGDRTPRSPTCCGPVNGIRHRMSTGPIPPR